MRNIDKNALELAFKLETGYYRESVPAKDYVEWLEEKVTEQLAIKQWVDQTVSKKHKKTQKKKPKITLCRPCIYYDMCHAGCKDKERCVLYKEE